MNSNFHQTIELIFKNYNGDYNCADKLIRVFNSKLKMVLLSNFFTVEFLYIVIQEFYKLLMFSTNNLKRWKKGLHILIFFLQTKSQQ